MEPLKITNLEFPSPVEGRSLDRSVRSGACFQTIVPDCKKGVDQRPIAITVRPPFLHRKATSGSLRVHFLCDNTAYRISQTLHLVNPAIWIAGSQKENAIFNISGVHKELEKNSSDPRIRTFKRLLRQDFWRV